MTKLTWLCVSGAISIIGLGCSPAGSSPARDGGQDVATDTPIIPTESGSDGFDAMIVPDGPVICDPGHHDVDVDGDGWTYNQGDCNDCINSGEFINPGAYDLPGDGIDNDCDGVVDNEPTGCDKDATIDSTDPNDGARAIGICRFTTSDAAGKDRTWGVINAQYVFPDGTTASLVPGVGVNDCSPPPHGGGAGTPPNPLSHGILPSFGNSIVPREGYAVLALSSGIARSGVNGDSPGGAMMCTRSATPPGFPPSSSQACGGMAIDSEAVANDPIALELTIRAPTNAKSFSFDFDFHTYEYPSWVCSPYNDFFVTLLQSDLFPAPDAGPTGADISTDSEGNPVSVNNGFFEVCVGGIYGQKNGYQKTYTCPLGNAELAGTGFDGNGATGWLTSSSTGAVAGKEFTLRFAIWDARDEILDSTVLIDHFIWDVKVNDGTVRPPK